MFAKKSIFVLLFLLALLPITINQAFAQETKLSQAQSLIKEAEDLRAKAANLISIGEKQSANIFVQNANQKLHDAIAILAHVLGDNPSDQKALFTLGIAYFYQGKQDKAREKFLQCSTSMHMKGAVYGFYKQQSNQAAIQNRLVDSLKLMREAIYFAPDYPRIKNELSQMGQGFFNNAVYLLDKGEFQGAKEYFLTAIACEPQLKAQSADKMIQAAARINDPVGQAKIVMSALEFDQSQREQIRNRAIEIGKTAKATDNKNIITKVKNIFQGLGQTDYSLFQAAVWPPKQWKTVYKKTFVGVGYTGGDDPKYNDGGIWTAKHEKDMKIGDRYTVIDSDFEVWDANSWKKCQKYQWLSVKGIQPGNNATFRNEKGKKFTVIIQRKI